MEDALYLQFTGWTFWGYVTGMYRMADGTGAWDRNAVYAVILDEDRLPELEDVLREFKKSTLQESIFLEIQRHVDFRLIS